MRSLTISWIAAAAAMSVCPSNADEPSQAELPATFERLLPLQTKLGPPQLHDWLAEHKEPGQTYSQYLRDQPIRVDKQRRAIYIQPLGEFDPAQRKVLNRTAEFLGIYFQLPVKLRDDLSLDVIPAEARREHPTWHVKQILSTYVLDKVLQPRLPADACVCIALTLSRDRRRPRPAFQGSGGFQQSCRTQGGAGVLREIACALGRNEVGHRVVSSVGGNCAT